MDSGKEKRRMNAEQIQEVLDVLGWNRTRLALELDVTENTVIKWLSGDRNASGPACILMRQWLEEARCSNGAKKPVVVKR